MTTFIISFNLRDHMNPEKMNGIVRNAELNESQPFASVDELMEILGESGIEMLITEKLHKYQSDM